MIPITRPWCSRTSDVKVSTRATQSSLDSLTTNFKSAYADYGKAYRGAAA